MKRALASLLRATRLRRPAVKQPPRTVKTLRTYPPGGDPFDDRIEFFLKEGGSAPSGFIPPREDRS